MTTDPDHESMLRWASSKEARLAVIKAQWQEIAKAFPRYQRLDAMLQLNKVYEFGSRADIVYLLSKRRFKDQVIYEVAKKLPELAIDRILNERSYAILFDRAAKYPEYADHKLEAVVELIVKHLKQGPFLSTYDREDELRDLLDEEEVGWRRDSMFLWAYIQGNTLASKEEVVAVMMLNAALFRYSHVAYSELKGKFKMDIEDQVHKNGMSWIDAANVVTNSPTFHDECGKCLPSRKRHYDEYDMNLPYSRRRYDH
jgi:hypothetical protein